MLIFNRLTVNHHVDIQSANNDQPLGGLALFGSKLYDTSYIIKHGIQNGLSPCDQLLQPNLHLNLNIYFFLILKMIAQVLNIIEMYVVDNIYNPFFLSFTSPAFKDVRLYCFTSI